MSLLRIAHAYSAIIATCDACGYSSLDQRTRADINTASFNMADDARCGTSIHGQEAQLCLSRMYTFRQLSRQRVGMASPDNSDTHDINARRCPASTRPQDCASARPARVARQWRTRGIQQQRHRRMTAGPAELQATHQLLRWWTGDVARRRRWRTGAGGHRGARSRSHVPAAERPELGLGEQESTHC